MIDYCNEKCRCHGKDGKYFTSAETLTDRPPNPIDNREVSSLKMSRPNGWQQRPFWARGRNVPFEHDAADRESCPFHDFWADGQFQPERHGIGDGPDVNNYAPPENVKRRDGNTMKLPW